MGYTRDKKDDDVVICSARRTALCKAKRGAFKNLQVEELLAPVISAVLEETNVNPALIQDIQIGNVLQVGAGIMSARMAPLIAGIPYSVPVASVNRQCSSGLQAVANIFHAIKSGSIDIGLAGGVESMSQYDMMSLLDPSKVPQSVLNCEMASKCLIPMGLTSEEVSKRFGITRRDQDLFAVESHQKACNAQVAGRFDTEIVPILVKKVTTGGAQVTELVKKDEGCVRTTLETISALRPAFVRGGTTTAGNASQLTDGASMLLLARRSAAKESGLPILGRFEGFSVVGVPPEVMGIGPRYAIPSVLKSLNLQIDQIDIFEINEAFSSQALYCARELKIPSRKLNPNGGAIALGHPLGCTGARQVTTAIHELMSTGKDLAVISMCVGGGMGAAAVISRE